MSRFDLLIVGADSVPPDVRAIRALAHKKSTIVFVGRTFDYASALIARFAWLSSAVDSRPAIYDSETRINGCVLSLGPSPFTSPIVFFGYACLHEASWIDAVSAQSVAIVNCSNAKRLRDALLGFGYSFLELKEFHLEQN
jgi:hypothetical protein